MFVNNETVSKGMVKYASALARESIVDVAGKVWVPKEPVQGCSQSQAGALRTMLVMGQSRLGLLVVYGLVLGSCSVGLVTWPLPAAHRAGRLC